MMLRKGDQQTGTVGTTKSGQKPRELAAMASHGKKTQAACSGHEECNAGKCSHKRALR